MLEENITGEPLPDAPHVSAPGGQPTVENVPQADALTLAELSAALGKDFPNKESALKSFKDTFSYVGKKKEDIEREVRAGLATETQTNQLAKEIENMRKEMFYKDNPQYADPSIRAIIEATGKNPVEAVELPAFKDVFSKVSGYDESQKLKTVLESNPRLNSSRDALTKAREMTNSSSELQGSQREERDALVVNAVKDVYGLK